jgi:putative acetyltransferase
MMLIRAESAEDQAEVCEVHWRAFADERILALVDGLREVDSTRSFVATERNQVVGHVMLSASRLDAPRRIVDVTVLSPLGVLPQWQGQGIGTRLIAHALAAAEVDGAPLVFLEGSPGYYGARGFRAAGELGFRKPSLRIPDASFQVVVMSSYLPWMTGSLVYADIFWALDCVGLRDPDA